jgi:hypothetical protein
VVPLVGRARPWRRRHLLITPAELAADPVFATRVAEILADPDAYPLPPRAGPSRGELLAALRRP